MVTMEEVDAWWHQRIQELKAEHDTDDVWGIPRDVWHEAQAEYGRRAREAHGRDPISAEKTPARRKAEAAGRSLEDAALQEAQAAEEVTEEVTDRQSLIDRLNARKR